MGFLQPVIAAHVGRLPAAIIEVNTEKFMFLPVIAQRRIFAPEIKVGPKW